MDPPAIKSSDMILSGPGDLPLLSFFKAFSISDEVVGSMGEDSLQLVKTWQLL